MQDVNNMGEYPERERNAGTQFSALISQTKTSAQSLKEGIALWKEGNKLFQQSAYPV